MNNDNQLNYNKPFDINEWKRLCEDAYDRLKHTRSEFQFIEALSQIDKMRCALFTTARVVCKKCGGTGEYNYPDTSAVVCDKCCGTGRSDRTGLSVSKESQILSE
jgi:RecJ-like exonuclease